jgi:Fe-S-cluster formation regulator IscX/YfhJ
MKKYDPDMLRALDLRAIILNALDALERYDDPAPAAVDLIHIAMLLDQALDLLSPRRPRRGRYTADLDKADAAIDELDRRLASIEPRTAAFIDLCEILLRRNSMDDVTDPRGNPAVPLKADRGESNVVLLTLLGGGAFQARPKNLKMSPTK